MTLPRRALAAVSFKHLEDLLDLPAGVVITGLVAEADAETLVLELAAPDGRLPVPPAVECDVPPTVDLHYRAEATLSGERLPRLAQITPSQVTP